MSGKRQKTVNENDKKTFQSNTAKTAKKRFKNNWVGGCFTRWPRTEPEPLEPEPLEPEPLEPQLEPEPFEQEPVSGRTGTDGTGTGLRTNRTAGNGTPALPPAPPGHLCFYMKYKTFYFIYHIMIYHILILYEILYNLLYDIS